jgi:GGDEF domain-containing protein
VGLTIMQGSQAELTQALRLADQALYAAKAAGKDRLEMAASA